MKVEKFNEAKDPIVGETVMTIETDITFKVSKNRTYTVLSPSAQPEIRYSLKVKIPGVNFQFGWYLINSNLMKEEIEQEKMNFLSKISNFHRNAKKYNI